MSLFRSRSVQDSPFEGALPLSSNVFLARARYPPTPILSRKSRCHRDCTPQLVQGFTDDGKVRILCTNTGTMEEQSSPPPPATAKFRYVPLRQGPRLPWLPASITANWIVRRVVRLAMRWARHGSAFARRGAGCSLKVSRDRGGKCS